MQQILARKGVMFVTEIPTTHQEREVEQKSVPMPNRESMTQSLEDIGLYGLTPQSDKVLNSFIGLVANSSKDGIGLALCWELASSEELRDYPREVHVIVSTFYERVIDTIIPEQQVATEAKLFRTQILEQVATA